MDNTCIKTRLSQIQKKLKAPKRKYFDDALTMPVQKRNKIIKQGDRNE